MISASVNLSVTLTGCAKMAERINVLFGVETQGTQETFYWMGIPHAKLL